MTEQDFTVFQESLERCLGGKGFVLRFYERLRESSPEAAEKFASTSWPIQKRKLTASLYMAMLLADDSPEGRAHFDRIAQLHGKEALDIRPDLYGVWIDTILESVAEFDPNYDDEIERVWRTLLQPAADYMKARYSDLL